MPGRKYSQPNSAYRFGFNGKEKSSEVSSDAYDYDARMYDGRIGRWLSVDPAFSKSPSFSPYSYCFNNPLIYTDPDGEYPLIVISNEVSGYTFAHVYSVASGKTTTVIVKTYKMIVYDVNAKGERKQLAEFYVTRDGWYNNGEITSVKTEATAGGKTKTTTTTEDLLVNRTSEPKSGDATLNAKPTIDYGDTKGAYALGTVESEPVPSSWDRGVNGESIPSTVKRSSPDKANGVMIHIGGVFTDPSGEVNLAGYYGCYGIVDPSQVYGTYGDAEKNLEAFNSVEINHSAPSGTTTSNNQMNKLVSTVQTATGLATKRKEKDASQTKVTIKKRATGTYKKEVKIKTGSTSVTD